MTHVWLSPSLPADPGAIAEELGPSYDVLPPSNEPPFGERPPVGSGPAGDELAGDELAGPPSQDHPQPEPVSRPRPQPPVPLILVATMYERDLLQILAARPADVVLVLITPPGVDAPPELGAQARPQVIGSAATVADVVALIRTASTETPADASPDARPDAPWWIGADRPASVVVSTTAPMETSTLASGLAGEPVGRAGGSRNRRNGVIAAAAVLVVVLGTAAGVMAASGGGTSASQAANSSPAGGQAGGTGEFPGGGRFGGGVGPNGEVPFGDGRFGDGRFGDGSGPAVDQDKLAQCLKGKGVTLDNSNGRSRPDLTDSGVRAAFRQCLSELAGTSGFQDGGPFGAPDDNQPGGSGRPDGSTSSGSSGGSGSDPVKPTVFVASAAMPK